MMIEGMTRVGAAIVLSMLFCAGGGHVGAADSTSVGARVDDFTLSDVHRRRHSLSDYEDAEAVVLAFLGTECPLAKLYGPRLAKLAAEYEPRRVVFLAINSNAQDSLSDVAEYARLHGFRFPMLKDLGNKVADALGAERTPEIFVLDRQRRVRYHGRIDDQYGVGYARDEPTRHDLRVALDEMLAGQPISQPETEAVGCFIGRAREATDTADVTYSNQIARIFQKHCVECHRPGEIAPFSLTSYDEVAGWADTLVEVIEQQRMPPWHANPRHGEFVNERLMTDKEKQLVHAWAAAGAPEGDPSQLPPPPEYVSGWRLSRPPEQVVAMRDRPFIVPPEGTVEYQYFVVDPGFTEDKWVQAAEVIPGNRSVVHHAIVFFRAPEGTRQHGLGWLTAYVPGQSTFEPPSHQARFVPAGSKFVFQMHYTPTGSPQEDITKVGLLFADQRQVTEELITLVAINHEFEIPPHAENFLVEASRSKFPAGARLHAIAPHMHVRGKSFQVLADRGREDSEQVLLDVPRYDFNWQHAYTLRQPLPLDVNTRLDCRALFDNSANNPVNPNPADTVRWGDQTWEEMMIAFFEISIPAQKRHADAAGNEPLTTAQQAHVRRDAEDLLRRFDADGDGVLRRDETPDSFAAFAFGSFDVNGDKVITPEEAIAAAERSLRRKLGGSEL